MATTPRPATTRSYTIPEVAAVTAIALIAAAALTVWAAGQLSSLVAGHGTIEESPASGLGVLLRLPDYWRTPAQAWPAPADRQVSGPIVFYAILVGILSAAIAAAKAGVAPLLLRHRARSWAFGVEPNAGLAKPSDLKALHIERRIPGRLTLGTVAGQLIAAEADTSLAVIGPTGCGKTIGFAIPAMLEWAEGPVLCTSVKTDLLQASLQRRRELGKVWIFDPTGSTSQPTAHWNPLQGCETFAGATQTAAWLTAALPTRRASLEDADHWENQARKALPALLMAAANQQLTMAHVARWIDLQEEQTIRETLLQVAGIDNKIGEILAPRTTQDITEEQLAQVHQQAVDELLAAGQLDALAAISALWDLDPRIQGSVYSTLQNIALVYTDPAVAAATTPPADTCLAVDFNEWLTGPNTIYLIAPSFDQHRLRPLFTAFLEHAVRTAFATANQQGGRLQRPCLLLLDEAANIAPARGLPQWAATARSHGITVASIWQDLAQIRAIYGDGAQTILNNHRARWFGTGLADDDALDYLSKLIGDTNTWERSWSTDLTNHHPTQTGSGGKRSISDSQTQRRAATADLLRRLQPGDGILIYGSTTPALVSLTPIS